MLDPSTTVILDSYTTLMVDWDLHAEADPSPYLNKKGEVDGFEVHRQKLLYNNTIIERLSALPSAEAALPPVPIEEEVPSVPVDVAPRPSVLAEVPPAAALPPDPTVPLPCAWAAMLPIVKLAARSMIVEICRIGSLPLV